tara:strand:- start:1272 stop:2183 length:912 start_codon:yes stop_codon:yes gene_type:complete
MSIIDLVYTDRVAKKLSEEFPKELDFKPTREPQIRNGIKIPNQYWTINPNTDGVIGSGKSRHRVDNFKDMWKTFSEGLLQSGLDLGELEVMWRIIHNRIGEPVAYSAELKLPNESYRKQLGEAACTKIILRDSHDQTVLRQIRAMVLRLACLNGMLAVGSNEGSSIFQKHTTFSDPETVGEVASQFPMHLRDQASAMNKMREVKVLRSQAISFFRDNVAFYKTKTGIKPNDSLLERIIGFYDNYSALGNNKYRVLNTLTHLSSHVDSLPKKADTCMTSKRIRMERDIQDVINSSEFQFLGMAA